MGLILGAACRSCGFARVGLRLGATMGDMSGEDRRAVHLYRCIACRDVAQVTISLGTAPGTPPCDRCGVPLRIARELEVRIVTMKGERLAGHSCPRCAAATLDFREEGRFL